MINKRTQLTLFTDEQEAEAIENIRSKFNPAQYALIKSHVTLCREDELGSVETIMQTLARLNHPFISIDFAPAARFADGKGVLIPSLGDNLPFHQLRTEVLQDINSHSRKYEPHITLIHPRNGTCTDAIFEQIKMISLPVKLVFKKIALIEQEAENKWNILQEFDLRK